MTLVIIHPGNGCEAIIREVGNELNDLEVHQYLCPNEAEFECIMVGYPTYVAKRACQEHATFWQQRFNAELRLLNGN